ncbi:hypothetical protein Btru_076337 [Bulinus truncatus]|nr:hypothetical protein Btru_076337 [Bulinus truncatus]
MTGTPEPTTTNVMLPSYDINKMLNITTNWSTTTLIYDTEKYLQELNARFASVILPAIVVLASLMVIGIIGNVIVLYVYCRRMKTGTITRYIQGLAIFDLLSCCLAIPGEIIDITNNYTFISSSTLGEIIDMTNNYTFGSNPLCQIVRTVNLLCTMASGSILIVVAIDRYKRICYPLGKQITPRCALYIMVACSSLACLFSLPTAVIFGARTVTTNITFINGSDCSVNDRFVNTVIPLLYNGSQMFLFLVGAIILIVLYSIIARRIFQHAEGRQRRRSGGNFGRTRRRIWSISYCSSPSVTPESGQDDNVSHHNWRSEIRHDAKKKFITKCYFCTGRPENSETSKDVHSTSHVEKDVHFTSHKDDQIASDLCCKRSNSHNDCHAIKPNHFPPFTFPTKVSPSTEDVQDSNNDDTSKELDDGRRTHSLPNKFRLRAWEVNVSPTDVDLTPPPTPIEEQNNQHRWLLSSASSGQTSPEVNEGRSPESRDVKLDKVCHDGKSSQAAFCFTFQNLNQLNGNTNLNQLNGNKNFNGNGVFAAEESYVSRRKHSALFEKHATKTEQGNPMESSLTTQSRS